MALEQAQVDRRRKVEYDAIAEKINTLPSRAELEQSVSFMLSEFTYFLRFYQLHSRNRERHASHSR